MFSSSGGKAADKGNWGGDRVGSDKGMTRMLEVEKVEEVWSLGLVFKSESVERAYR